MNTKQGLNIGFLVSSNIKEDPIDEYTQVFDYDTN